MEYLLRIISEQIGAELSGNADERIAGVNALETAQPGQLTFAEHEKYAPQVQQTRASAIIVPKSFPVMSDKNLLRVEHPRLAFLKVMYLFQPKPTAGVGVDPHAAIAADAQLGENVTIRQYAVIGSRVRIGPRTVIESGVHVGEGAVIGDACFLGPNVVIMQGCHIGHRVMIHGGTVIGGDGFGYIFSEGRHVKIPQLGNVVIEDDVEIGCNVCVDRATLGSTIIKRGTKIDNLVQIAHNDIIGRHVIITGQGGFSGSVTIGDYVVCGGRVAAVDHVIIGEGAKIGMASIITKSVPPGEVMFGYPARPARRVKRELAGLAHLPRLLQQMRDLRQQVSEAASRLALLEQTGMELRTHQPSIRLVLQSRLVAFGQVLSRLRSWTPIPLILLLIFCTFRKTPGDLFTWLPGLLFLGLGEELRLWSASVLGKDAHLRSDSEGPVVTDGPYAYVRNPFYLGNLLLLIGAVFISELLWMLPIAVGLFALQYVPIVIWEEQLLTKRFGVQYAAYCQQVPRWLPQLKLKPAAAVRSSYRWGIALWSERRVLMALGLLLVAMLAKEDLGHLPKYLRKHGLQGSVFLLPGR